MAERPPLVHVLEDIQRDASSGEAPERGRLEAADGFLEFRGDEATLRMTPVRDISAAGGRVVVAYGEPGTPCASFVSVGATTREEAQPASVARRLREIVGLPPVEPQRVAGKAWGCAVAGVAGGYLVGVALGGAGLSVSTFVEAVGTGSGFALGSLAFAFLIGRQARVAALARWTLAASAISAGVLIGASGAPEMANPEPDDWRELVATPPAVAGEALLGLAVVTAVVIGSRRFAPASTPPSVRRELFAAGAVVAIAIAALLAARGVVAMD